MHLSAEAVETPISSELAQLEDDHPFTEFRVSLVSESHPMLFTRVAPARDMQTAMIRAIAEFESLNGPTKRWLCITVRPANVPILSDVQP